MFDPKRKPISVWTQTYEVPRFASISEPLDCDICIIGGGITGLNCAYQLSRAGKSVVVLEDGIIASGETKSTTAHISTVIDSLYQNIIRFHGDESARLVFQSLETAVDEIANIIEQENINCDFARVEGCLFNSHYDSHTDLQKEYEACLKVGFKNIDLIENFPLLNGSSTKAITFPNQAQFHILKYMSGLVEACRKRNVRFHTRTHVTEIIDGKRPTVYTNLGHWVKADSVIVATNSPISDFVKVHTKQAPYRTYAIAMLVNKGTVPQALYWDTEDPYHYIRLQDLDDEPELQLLIVGGEDHRTGQSNDAKKRFTKLEKYARAFCPNGGDIAFKWSGQIYESVDGLSFIGKDPAHNENIYIATGDSGMGMTHATLSGLILTDAILGKENRFANLYEPSRKVFNASLEYLKENVNSLSQYSSYITPPSLSNIDDLRPGQGGVIMRDGYHVAMYKDEKGILHEKSAYCPHMKGVVCFNGLEKTWDCPVHGARFNLEGKVLDGPANDNLDEARKEFKVDIRKEDRKAS
ncbi:MAG: FAD-dependent oxidoreductase [Cyanobacteria bacterium TGS_CYA1]|nr:FAD-dependent oxidoreductase [Cyanobacteria bacterium TGS_CYA1]